MLCICPLYILSFPVYPQKATNKPLKNSRLRHIINQLKIKKMRKMIFAAMAIFALASCSDNTENLVIDNESNGNSPEVCITLKAEENTRAFFDNETSAEAWEKEIKTLETYVFDKDGSIVLKRTMTDAEITAKSARFSLPNSTAGTQCSFYVVANANYGDIGNVSTLDNASENIAIKDYNGTFSQVTTSGKLVSGFVMTGKTNITIADAGNSTTVGITLKRIVAKIAVRTQLSDDFTTNYNGGKVVITEATISQTNALSYSFANSSGAIEKNTFFAFTQPSQNTSGYFDNLFYIHENSVESTEEDRVRIGLKGYFDADGNLATTQDQIEVEYSIYLVGAANGEIKRNGYYRVDATIKGLSGDGLIVNFTIADWETPVTQNVDLGV